MSFDFVAEEAKLVSNGNPQKLLNDLQPSTLMEASGEVFDPDRMIVDKKLHLVLRKEQFHQGSDLPTELLVADRRYTFDDLRALCEPLLDIHSLGYVKAGDFERVDSGDPT